MRMMVDPTFRHFAMCSSNVVAPLTSSDGETVSRDNDPSSYTSPVTSDLMSGAGLSETTVKRLENASCVQRRRRFLLHNSTAFGINTMTALRGFIRANFGGSSSFDVTGVTVDDQSVTVNVNVCRSVKTRPADQLTTTCAAANEASFPLTSSSKHVLSSPKMQRVFRKQIRHASELAATTACSARVDYPLCRSSTSVASPMGFGTTLPPDCQSMQTICERARTSSSLDDALTDLRNISSTLAATRTRAVFFPIDNPLQPMMSVSTLTKSTCRTNRIASDAASSKISPRTAFSPTRIALLTVPVFRPSQSHMRSTCKFTSTTSTAASLSTPSLTVLTPTILATRYIPMRVRPTCATTNSAENQAAFPLTPECIATNTADGLVGLLPVLSSTVLPHPVIRIDLPPVCHALRINPVRKLTTAAATSVAYSSNSSSGMTNNAEDQVVSHSTISSTLLSPTVDQRCVSPVSHRLAIRHACLSTSNNSKLVSLPLYPSSTALLSPRILGQVSPPVRHRSQTKCTNSSTKFATFQSPPTLSPPFSPQVCHQSQVKPACRPMMTMKSVDNNQIALSLQNRPECVLATSTTTNHVDSRLNSALSPTSPTSTTITSNVCRRVRTTIPVSVFASNEISFSSTSLSSESSLPTAKKMLIQPVCHSMPTRSAGEVPSTNTAATGRPVLESTIVNDRIGSSTNEGSAVLDWIDSTAGPKQVGRVELKASSSYTVRYNAVRNSGSATTTACRSEPVCKARVAEIKTNLGASSEAAKKTGTSDTANDVDTHIDAPCNLSRTIGDRSRQWSDCKSSEATAGASSTERATKAEMLTEVQEEYFFSPRNLPENDAEVDTSAGHSSSSERAMVGLSCAGEHNSLDGITSDESSSSFWSDRRSMEFETEATTTSNEDDYIAATELYAALMRRAQIVYPIGKSRTETTANEDRRLKRTSSGNTKFICLKMFKNS